MIINNKSDLFILREFLTNNKISTLQSITIIALRDELAIKNLKYSINKVRNTLNEFTSNGLVEKGMKQSRADTFFISKLGIETLSKLVNGGNVNDKK